MKIHEYDIITSFECTALCKSPAEWKNIICVKEEEQQDPTACNSGISNEPMPSTLIPRALIWSTNLPQTLAGTRLDFKSKMTASYLKMI